MIVSHGMNASPFGRAAERGAKQTARTASAAGKRALRTNQNIRKARAPRTNQNFRKAHAPRIAAGSAPFSVGLRPPRLSPSPLPFPRARAAPFPRARAAPFSARPSRPFSARPSRPFSARPSRKEPPPSAHLPSAGASSPASRSPRPIGRISRSYVLSPAG